MQYLDARIADPEIIVDAAVAAIANGKLIAFPTDTVYGMLCDPDSREAIAEIYAGKGRSRDKPLSLLIASVEELLAFAHLTDRIAIAAVREFLPGPLTVVVQRPESVSVDVTAGRSTVGLRVPDHPLLQRLLTRTGPLASTSANLSGTPAYDGVSTTQFPDVDLFVDAGPTLRLRESSVVDFTAAQPRMLREGALAKARFDTWLGNLDVV